MHNTSKGHSKLLIIFFLLITLLLVVTLILALSRSKRPIEIRENLTLLEGMEYPVEISELNSNDLLSLECSKTFHKQSDYNYVSRVEDSNLYLSDPKVISFLKGYNSSNSKDIAEIIKCIYPDERILLLYNVRSETGNTWYVGVLNKNNSVDPQTAIPNNETPNFLCRWPIAITDDQRLFVECGGGIGKDIEATIYMIDLKDGNLTKIISCTHLGECK